ncbi:MAG TPA: hypothetical protein VGQ83_35895 [Polyangia bacterium]|jgi:hypothetical protein
MRARTPVALAAVLLALLARAAPAGAEPPPPGVAEWQAHLETFYRHYKRVVVALERGPEEPATCDPKDRLLKQLKLEPWRLQATLVPRDPKLFAEAAITVRRLRSGVDAMALYKRAARRPAPHECWVSKATHVVAQLGPWLVELQVGCRAGALWFYEAADFLELLTRRDADTPPPASLVVSHCGMGVIAFQPAAAVRDEGRKPRRLWGRAFPEARLKLRDQAP